MHIATKTEAEVAVVTQDGTVDRQLAANRHIGIPPQHLVPEQVKRILGPGDVCAHEVEWRYRELADHRTDYGLQPRRKHSDKSCAQADHFRSVRLFEKLSPPMYCTQQSFRIANVERYGYCNKRDAIPQFERAVFTSQVDGHHHSAHPAFGTIAMELQVTANGCGHQCENHIIHTRAQCMADCFYVREGHIGPGKFLWTTVHYVEAKPLRETRDFWQQFCKLLGLEKLAAIHGGAFSHIQQICDP